MSCTRCDEFREWRKWAASKSAGLAEFLHTLDVQHRANHGRERFVVAPRPAMTNAIAGPQTGRGVR